MTPSTQDARATGLVEEPTDTEFISDLAGRMFRLATPAMGFDQNDIDRLHRIARDLATATVMPGDITAAEEWRFIECRHCSEYEGDFVTDLAADFARRRALAASTKDMNHDG